jgi:hypothetical protein
LAKDELVGHNASLIVNKGNAGPLNLFDFDFTDPVTPCGMDEDSEPEPPMSDFLLPPQRNKNLRQLVDFI